MAHKRKVAASAPIGRVARAIVAARRAEIEAWHTITIPKPPSTNNLYANRKGRGGRIKSARAKQWAKVAGYAVLASRPPRLDGGYELRIELGRRKGSDLGNFEKAISDLLVEMRIVRDDSLCERLVLEWADDLASADARVSWRPRVRTIAAAEPRESDKRKRAPRKARAR